MIINLMKIVSEAIVFTYCYPTAHNECAVTVRQAGLKQVVLKTQE